MVAEVGGEGRGEEAEGREAGGGEDGALGGYC